MGRRQLDLLATGLKSVGPKACDVGIGSEIIDGPVAVIGRRVDVRLTGSDMAFFLASVAQMPKYRQVFATVARILDERETEAGDPEAMPNRRMSAGINSLQTHNVIQNAIREILAKEAAE